MNTGFSILVAFLLSLLHHGDATLNAQTTAQVEVTPTVTPSVSPTETITPTDTVTPSVTPDVTVTPSVTPSVSVTPTGLPKGDGDKDDMLGLKADFHGLVGLMNAAFHHETNETRSESRHGGNDDGQTGQSSQSGE
ncbi:MAG TPA: hypothetical protein VFQ63_00340 [Patescibacteria group bacterium]|nr:hypothetical protein [Patescibacteria group bacterium]